MKLYYLPGACPLATQIVLEWTATPYELQAVSRSEIKEPAYLALNPLGSVPVLVDGDFVLTQSAATLEYVADLHPKAGLVGDTPRQRAETHRWLGFCNSDLHRTFSLVFGPAAYADSDAGQKELAEKASARVVFLFSVVDKQLAGRDWLTGLRSIADPYLYTITRWAKAKKLDIGGLANLQAHYDRLHADAGVQAALKKQGLE
ncbi:glutathione S-transferase N-terminal domain-containing protein [Candidimonas humi]|uniref:Glutathione S-transferase family protein n=1 Tax=Candidimonas humi TaxID=683355 RepID=A0ABV8NV24_9BURK|nr:glutathione S-transferase N-terminal domain-containing protein [Candidimonas humi]MBV6303471.1 glutathione S-transferase N-terminal domain-containing protein [Candidimonas humi]